MGGDAVAMTSSSRPERRQESLLRPAPRVFPLSIKQTEIAIINIQLDKKSKGTVLKIKMAGNSSKKRLRQEQLHLLETSFIRNPKLEGERKHELASQLGLPPKQVAIWYQNKRARCKTEAIELEYEALQLQLQNVLAHNKQLQSEVRRLTHKLTQAHHQHLLFLASNSNPSSAGSPPASTAPSWEWDYSSPGTTINCSVSENAQVLPIMEELYACLLD